jgi:transposase
MWTSSMAVYQIGINGVRLDSTTISGYHTMNEEGLMQFGHSKDHRPDLPQVKLMAAAAEPSGLQVASDVVSGERADDHLYTPRSSGYAKHCNKPVCYTLVIVKWLL